jgi:hypothetical protein
VLQIGALPVFLQKNRKEFGSIHDAKAYCQGHEWNSGLQAWRYQAKVCSASLDILALVLNSNLSVLPGFC